MSLQASSWAWTQDIGAGAQRQARKLLLLALADFADEKGYCFPSNRALTRKTSMSENTVRARRAELAAAGLLFFAPRARGDGGHTSNEYVLLLGDAARELAAEKGWSIADERPREPRVDAVQMTLELEMDDPPCTLLSKPLAAACGSPPHAAEDREPSREPSGEPPPLPPQFVQRHDPVGEGGSEQGRAGKPEAEHGAFEDLETHFPANALDLTAPARRAWARLAPGDRADALRCAPAYVAAARAAGHKLKHRAGYLLDRAWEKFAGAGSAGQGDVAAAAAAILTAATEPTGAAVLRRLRLAIGNEVFVSWFREARFTVLPDGTAEVALPTRFTTDWVKANFDDQVRAAVFAAVTTCRCVRYVKREVPPGPAHGGAHRPMAMAA